MPYTCDTSVTRVRHKQHGCEMNDTIVTRVKNFDFDNDTSENIFSHPYTSYMANERMKDYKERNNFILRSAKDYLLEMPPSHAKMRLESAPQKLNFVMIKVGKKSLSSLNYYKRMS